MNKFQLNSCQSWYIWERKNWEKRINYLSIEWQIVDWVIACERWKLRYEYKSWLEYTKISTRCDTKLCTRFEAKVNKATCNSLYIWMNKP